MHGKEANSSPDENMGLESQQRAQLETIDDLRMQTEDELRESHRLRQEALDELIRARLQAVPKEHLLALEEITIAFAHDFTNTLLPILGLSELLLVHLEVLDDTEKASYLQMINTAARDGKMAVDKMLLFFQQDETAGEAAADKEL